MSTFTVKPLDKSKVKNKEQVVEIEDAEAILLQAVLKYKEIQSKISYLQEELKAPRNIIESAVKCAPEMRIVTPAYKITYNEITSERFDKESAIKALGRKKLAPFLSNSTYYQLRVA